MRPFTLLITMASIASLACLPLRTHASSSHVDPALFGTWQGERNPQGPCKYLAWTLTRTADGMFTVRYFQDAQRTAFIDEEKGVWTTAGGRLTVLTEGDDRAEVFAYALPDKDTVTHGLLTPDPDGSCPEDAAYSEHRLLR